MNKAIISILILAVTIITALVLYDIITTRYAGFNTFWPRLYLGLVVFGSGVGIFISGVLMERAIRQQRG